MRPSPIHRRFGLLATAAGLVVFVAACSSATGASTAPNAPASSPPSNAPASAAAGAEHVVAVASGALGSFLTGKDGLTLYIFTPDSANTSTCVDGCAQAWPPFTIKAGDTVKGGDGVTGALTTFTRPDGSLQVAYDGIPLYYYANDAKAGDTTGQGVGGKWYVASPTGATPSSSGGRIGY